MQSNKNLKEKGEMPSSQSYNHSFYGTIEDRSKRIHTHSRNNLSSHTIDKFSGGSYFKEIEKDYLNKESPGPAAYFTGTINSLSNFRKSFDGSFTRAKRYGDRHYTKRSPGPCDYDTKTVYKNFNSIVGAGTIGKSKRFRDARHSNAMFIKDVLNTHCYR